LVCHVRRHGRHPQWVDGDRQRGLWSFDEVVIFEGSADSYLAWTPPEQLAAVRQHAIDTNAEHRYFTDQGMPNPWSKLSLYWPQ
jgi:hypothetical protein